MRNLSHLAKAFSLKGSVTDGQNFVDEQNFGFEMRGDGEGQTHLHPAAVVFQRSIEKAFHFREGHDLVELPFDFRFAHTKEGAAHEHILAARELRMETRADLEKAADAPANL